MSTKCGKRCAQRGCQNLKSHTGKGTKFCPPCCRLISAGRTAGEMCLRCQWLYYTWACTALGAA